MDSMVRMSKLTSHLETFTKTGGEGGAGEGEGEGEGEGTLGTGVVKWEEADMASSGRGKE